MRFLFAATFEALANTFPEAISHALCLCIPLENPLQRTDTGKIIRCDEDVFEAMPGAISAK